MLSDVAAVLSTSAVLLGAVGGFVVSAEPGAATAERPAEIPAAHAGLPEPFIGPEPAAGRVPAERLPQLRGVALLEQLALLPRAQLADVLERHPEAVAGLLAVPPPAADVAAWWEHTPRAARATIAIEAPALIGNLEGLPYDTAAALRATIAEGVGRAVEGEFEARLGMLAEVEAALRPGATGAPRTLVSLDVTGEGRAVVAVGDLDAASYVSYLVPGMYFGVSAQLVDWTATADALLAIEESWLDRLGDDAAAATVAWIGYRTPTLLTASTMELAYEGRDALIGSLDGLAAARADAAPHVAVVAHSYGSTAAMLALEERDADALVMVGSPGGPVRAASDLRVPAGAVWVGAAAWDPIPRSGVFGSQPLAPGFGATAFATAAAVDPVTGEELAASPGHNDYFTPGTTTMRNMALLAIGRPDLVLPTDGGPTAARARAG